MNEPNDRKGLPPWAWVLVSVLVMGLVAIGGLALGVGLLARRTGGGTEGAGAASASPLAVSTDDFVIVVADRNEQPEDVLRAAAVTASARGLRPFAYATASWCQPCRKLERSMSDPRMKAAFHGTYVVKLDIDDFGDARLANVGLRVRAVPSFYELDPGGMPTGRSMVGDWGPDTPENMAPALQRFFASGR